jgi:hypothetical protein
MIYSKETKQFEKENLLAKKEKGIFRYQSLVIGLTEY